MTMCNEAADVLNTLTLTQLRHLLARTMGA